MDERLEQALKNVNYMIVFENQKRILKEKYQNDLLFFFQGSQFTVNQHLISFLASLKTLNQTETILTDDSDHPVFVENLDEFLTNVLNVYATATNMYLTEYNKLKKNRTAKGLFVE